MITDEEMWAEWEKEHADELKEIEMLKEAGHSRHCACRIVWGDGECECGFDDAINRSFDPARGRDKHDN